MRYIRDATGRFPERPYYEDGELDDVCERIVETFLASKYGHIRYPIPTDGLQVLIEQQDAVLDCFADLSPYGGDADGASTFEPDAPARVYISKELSENPARENRFRTTLAHEFSHVYLHGPLFRAAKTADLFDLHASSQATCTHRSVEVAPQADWLEWQAGYVSGALLMPILQLKRVVAPLLSGRSSVPMASLIGASTVDAVAREFQVSREAAEVRLQQVGLATLREVTLLL